VSTKLQRLVDQYRCTRLEGRFVDLVPYDKSNQVDVVRLRNLPAARQFLSQGFLSTREAQRAWYEAYLTRRNDIAWVVCDKAGRAIGTNRVDGIGAFQAEKGSQIIDGKVALGAPYALETELMLVRFVFGVLGIPRLIAHIREDNEKVHSFNLRLGFGIESKVERDGIHYLRFALSSKDFNSAAFDAIIEHWIERRERGKAPPSVC